MNNLTILELIKQILCRHKDTKTVRPYYANSKSYVVCNDCLKKIETKKVK